MDSSKKAPTQEQSHAVQCALEGQKLKISAYAGSGKTSTLKMMGEAMDNRQCTYLAFNKAIATEAQSKFTRNVSCKTFHSLAYNAVPRYITKKISNNRWMPSDMARQFGLRSFLIPLEKTPDKSAELNGWDQAMILNKALDFFCRSNSNEVVIDHVMNAIPNWAHKKYAVELAHSLVPHANRLWEMSIDERTQIKISHDVYLKLWSLSKPKIFGDTIFMDEAQDADPIMLDILEHQDAQVIYVGDRHQQIYAWRGALNAMQSVNAPECLLTKSFRFGENIANQANLILRKLLDEKVPLVGNEKLNSTVNADVKPNAYLVRTNAGAFALALDLVREGLRPRVEIDTSSVKRNIEDVKKLQQSQPVQKTSEFFGFQNWEEVIRYVESNENCDLTPFVRLVQKNDISVLEKVLESISQADGNCVVSTAHKSKGLEFSNVQLHNDYTWDPDAFKVGKPITNPAEARLIYVAATRAINNLATGGMSEFFDKLKTKY